MDYLTCPHCGGNNFVGQYFAEISQEVQIGKRDQHTFWEWGEEEHRNAQPDEEIKTVYCRPCDKDINIGDLIAPSP